MFQAPPHPEKGFGGAFILELFVLKFIFTLPPNSTDSMPQYIVVIQGKPCGPYPPEKLKELGITPSTFVKTGGMDDYKEAHEVPELRELLGMARQQATPQYFATLDIRLLATAIDYFILFGVYCLLALVAVSFSDQKNFKIILSLSGLALIPPAKFLYSAWMESSRRKGTFGKYWLGIKVTDEEGLALSFGRAAIRNLSKLLSALPLGLGYLMGFFNKRQQCLHDRIAGTLVIKDRLI